ncbi:unnamed protein product [Clonostachys solani]|uniref:AAA+ ATPase domain-containing protein n=1 Tax=Clonostachys solani TaxID=160281 RepID=A0A9P0EIT5_9HYPO|nr:unnamed protein product [Clonostachys solani]
MKPKSEPMIEHKHLWCFFKPGTLVHAAFNDVHLEGDEYFQGQPISKGLFRFLSITPTFDERFRDTVKTWNLKLEYIDYTGEKHEYASFIHHVHKYEGLKCLKDINPTPLEFHPDAEGIMEECLRKGEKFVSLCGIHYRFTAGVGRYPSQSQSDSSTWNRIMEHRIMIDFATFWENPASMPQWSRPRKGLKTGNEKTPDLSDVELMLCTSSVPGFSFTLRQWGIFDIDDIREIDFNLNVFEQLCIPEERKDLILSLVSQHDQGSTAFDDIIQGKGKGLIFLLHGPPGVGKTLTAESIADHTRRPLMAVSSGDLLGYPKSVELVLKDIFQQTKRWGALVLIDEADVFLQQRDMLSLERNGLVSVMLRILEYFEGILFLTTNRVETIDPAFRSRIHLALYYPPLSTDYLRKLWKNTIIRACNSKEPTWLTEEMLDFLSKSKVNGRDIKNIVRMAHARATNNKRQMESNDITIGLGALEEFSEDFYRQKTKQGPLQSVCCSQDLAC